jgi:hypothetical protein
VRALWLEVWTTTEDCDGFPPPMATQTEEPELVSTATAVQTFPKGGLAEIPGVWDVGDPLVVYEVMQRLMPGKYETRHYSTLATKWRNWIAAMSKDDGAAGKQWAPTMEDEVTALLHHVDLRDMGRVSDPYCGSGTVGRVINQRQKVMVQGNDINPGVKGARTHMNALHPKFYQELTHTLGGKVQGFVTSPWFRFLDLAVPLLVAHATEVIAVHVPGDYLTNAHAARRAYLRGLAATHVMRVVAGLPVSVTGRRCVWLVIFKSVGTAHRRWRGGEEPLAGFFYDLDSEKNSGESTDRLG